MAKYMITGSYTAEGAKGLMADGGSGRRKAVEGLVEALGGTVECVYFMFGSEDVIAIIDLPDAESVAAAALTVGASGAVAVRTTVLLTPEQVDAAVKKSPAYRPPGG